MRMSNQEVTDVEFRENVTLANVWFYQDRTCPFTTYAHLQPPLHTTQDDLFVGIARGLSALQVAHKG